jgi:putative intracellular protease/amidase
VLTSRDKPGRKTGYRLEEFATPCYVFRYAGVELTLASPKGGATADLFEERSTRGPDTSQARFKGDPVPRKGLDVRDVAAYIAYVPRRGSMTISAAPAGRRENLIKRHKPRLAA